MLAIVVCTKILVVDILQTASGSSQIKFVHWLRRCIWSTVHNVLEKTKLPRASIALSMLVWKIHTLFLNNGNAGGLNDSTGMSCHIEKYESWDSCKFAIFWYLKDFSKAQNRMWWNVVEFKELQAGPRHAELGATSWPKACWTCMQISHHQSWRSCLH